MSGQAITIQLARDEAVVLDACLARMVGEHDLHEWDQMKLTLDQETEQWPIWSLRNALADQLAAENCSANYNDILSQAHKSISARQWGE